MKTTYETGILGEEAAADYLRETCGMILVERRFRTRCGEIDLILMDGDTVVFAEVKTRKTSGHGSGLAAVDLKKKKRILNAALVYLAKMKWTDRIVRFDVVEICRDGVLHVPDAFRPYGDFYH